MICNLYINNSPDNAVTKSLQFVGEYDIQLKEDCSVYTPTIILRSEGVLPQFNYFELPDFGRKYFFTDLTYSGNLAFITGKTDTLSTFFGAIVNRSFMVERQEHEYSPYIIDSEMLTRCDKDITTIDIGGVGSNTNYYYLCANGG